ncbi:MAG: hypothetical protein ACKO2P_09585 [Planctomycetota bacterium]
MKLSLSLTLAVRAESPGSESGASSAAGDPAATAVLIFGRTAAEWLAPLCSCRIPTSELVILPLSNPGTGAVFGAVVAGAGLSGRLLDLQHSAMHESAGPHLPLIVYRCLAGQLFIPAEATLSLPLTDAELRALLPVHADHRLVWHPAVGLVEYEAEDVLSVVDLLSGPVQTVRIWNGATPGDQLNLMIRSLQPWNPPEEILNVVYEGRGDIGSAAGDLHQAPRAPDERPEGALREALHRLRQQLAKAICRVTNLLPESPDGSQLAGRLHAWAERLARGGHSLGHSSNPAKGTAGHGALAESSSLSTRQENELKRLLHMLEKQPDEGLKYALPLGGDRSRGTTAPTDRLGEQRPDFDVGQLNATGPASVWKVPSSWHAVLTRRYRELALRELRLGHHRRAAYIYAMLLNDLHSAASVLEAGRLYRDAASIWQLHLKQPLLAAECFRRGGLWEEAAAIFRDLRQWRKAAELFRQLDRPELAAEMYEQELRELVEKHQWPAAATVAIDFLGDRMRGLQLLRDGWFSKAGQETCLRRLFQEHADAGEHQLMEDDLQTLIVNAKLSSDQREIAVVLCSEQAAQYPAARVRELLRIQTWQLAAVLIAGNPALPSRTAVRAIRNLAEHDELLQRDATRCGWKPPQPPKLAVTRAANGAEVPVDRSASAKRGDLVACATLKLTAANLPDGVGWMAAVTSAESLFCLGETPNRQLVVARWSLAGLQQGNFRGQCVTFPVFDPEPRGVPQLRLNPLRPEQVNLQFFPAAAECVRSTVSGVVRSNSFVGSMVMPHALTFDYGFTPDGSRFSLGIAEADLDTVELELADRKTNGKISFRLQLPDQLTESLIENGGRVWLENSALLVISGRFVCYAALPAVQRLDRHPAQPVQLECLAELDSECTAFFLSPPLVVPRVLIQTQASCYVVWLNSASWSRIAEELQAPRVCWTRNGIVVTASANTLCCYRVTQKKIQRLSSGTLPRPILSLQADDSPDHVLALDETGTLQRFRVPVE